MIMVYPYLPRHDLDGIEQTANAVKISFDFETSHVTMLCSHTGIVSQMNSKGGMIRASKKFHHSLLPFSLSIP